MSIIKIKVEPSQFYFLNSNLPFSLVCPYAIESMTSGSMAFSKLYLQNIKVFCKVVFAGNPAHSNPIDNVGLPPFPLLERLATNSSILSSADVRAVDVF